MFVVCVDYNEIDMTFGKIYDVTHVENIGYAKALLESGAGDWRVDLRIIQKCLGHSSVKTTQVYTHVSTNILKNIPLPI